MADQFISPCAMISEAAADIRLTIARTQALILETRAAMAECDRMLAAPILYRPLKPHTPP